MYSILVKDRLIKCPNCPNYIRSTAPECTKCGLKTSEEGICELAVIDEQNLQAKSDAEDLFYYLGAAFVYLGIAYILSRIVPSLGGSPLFVSVIGLVMFWWKFFCWYRKHDQMPFADNSFIEAKKKLKQAAIFGVIGSTLIIAFIYFLIR